MNDDWTDTMLKEFFVNKGLNFLKKYDKIIITSENDVKVALLETLVKDRKDLDH